MSSGRYRSTVLNFLSRQSLRLRDRSAQTWRQAKTAAVWGAQILLYPIYVGFQATRLAGKQLRHTARQVFPRLRGASRVQSVSGKASDPASHLLPVDAPIQNALQVLHHLALALPARRIALQLDPQDADAPGRLVVVGGSAIVKQALMDQAIGLEVVGIDSPRLLASSADAVQPAAIRVRGIACLLQARNLVLVSVDNQVLDVLSQEQQFLLQRQMAADLAIYWRQQRLLEVEHQAFDRLLPLPKPRTHALLPIRAFWRLMTWMQTSSVAIAANLFQESRLALLPSGSNPSELPVMRSAQPIWKPAYKIAEDWQRWVQNRYSLQGSPKSSVQPQQQEAKNQRVATSWLMLERSPDPLIEPVSLPSHPLSSVDSHSLSKLPPAEGLTVAEAAPGEELVAQPSWIEAEVRLVAYEQHPIERLLDWIDRGMSWIEHQVTHVWEWLRNRW